MGDALEEAERVVLVFCVADTLLGGEIDESVEASAAVGVVAVPSTSLTRRTI